MERGRIQGLPQIFSNPIISGKGKATNFKLGRYIHRVHANKSLLKIWENRERGRIQGPSKFLKYPYLMGESRDPPNFWSTPISGTDKAANFIFGRYIHRVHSNKSPLKFWEKMERGRIQGLPKFFEYLLLSQERIKLRTSNFVRTLLVSIGTKVHYKFVEK